jgi:hypothetical protein
MTIGEEIVQKHFGTYINHFRHIVIDIDRAIRAREMANEELAEECARLRRERDEARG